MIEIKNLSKSYKEKKVLSHISMEFNKKNTIYTIIGDSGTGKTTLFNILYGIDQKFDGEYYFDKKDVKTFTNKEWDTIRNKKIGIVFQDYKLFENLTVYDNLIFSCFLPKKTKISKINEMLALMDLNDVKDLKVSKISGGQKQRLAIARAVINNPKLLLLDEPTGNLDDFHTESIMKYIEKIKKDRIIIIITHDKRIESYSNIIYQLKNKNLICIKTDNRKEKKEWKKQEIMKDFFMPSKFKYFLFSLKSRIKEFLLCNLPVCMIISMFICIFCFVYLQYNTQLELLYNGLSDDAIYISSSNFNQAYIDKNNSLGMIKSDDGTRINFSKDDLEKVKNITHVTKAKLYNSSNISLFDKDHSLLNLIWEREDFSNMIKSQASYSSSPNIITFKFNSMNIPYEYAEKYHRVSLMFGDYPKDDSYEILIPDILAYSYCNQLNDCISEKIKLNTYNSKEEYSDKEYTIVGIYQTDFQKYIDNEYAIYVNYMEYDFLDLFLKEEEYRTMKKEDKEANKLVKDYHNSIYDSYESYVTAIGTNLGDLIIVVDKSENVKYVQEKLSTIFPNLLIVSQYELKYGETSLAYRKIKLYIFGAILSLSFVLGLIIIFLNKAYIKNRNKEFAILYSIGYSRTYVLFLIILEYVVTVVWNMLFAYFILKILQMAYFGNSANYQLFDAIFSFSNICPIVFFVFIIFLLSALFSLYGINKRKLRKYLED